MATKHGIDIDYAATRWYNEVYIERDLSRWHEFESWLRADPRHRAAYKELEEGVPRMILKIIRGEEPFFLD